MKRIMIFLFVFVISFMLLSCDESSSSTLDPQEQTFIISWLNHDGTVLKVDEVSYGKNPVYNGEEPVKASTSEYFYTFFGWDSDLSPAIEDKAYKASYIEMPISFLSIIEDLEYDFFNFSDLASFDVYQGWYNYTENFLFIRTSSDISIYELNEGKTNLVYSFDISSDEKGIVDIEIDSNGNLFLLGYHIPENADSDTYLPGFIIKINSDFSGYSLHDIDNIGMRVPRAFSINSNHEFGVIGEGSTPETAYLQHSFMIYDENYNKVFSYEMNHMIRGEYRKIESKNDSFIVAGLVGDSIGCTNGDCMDPVIQEFNSSEFLLNEVFVEYDMYDEILELIVNEDEIVLLINNDYRAFKFLKLDYDLNIIYNEEIYIEGSFVSGAIEHKGSMYLIARYYNRYIFFKINNSGEITNIYIDELTSLYSSIDREFYLNVKILVSSFDE
ncbi:MAG: hypothetical protein AB7E09_07500 [Candidatus Izemoplasmatales bacterium]